ncbi:MAG TPA: 2-phospho-L-lactate guanylyltransferase [Blastocatellia bacterium]|jgi:2-phospho-L-lactate guanylyltransferase|nr:2-phospho-L-lactate guanylyltransferase [Blastocatellia bacterium]
MRYILIPVKDLTRAKQRLALLMTQEERTRLAWAMLENTFAAAVGARNVDRIAVVTLYAPAIELARKYGMELIAETEQVSESASVDFGSKEAKKRGATSVLRLPIDLPLVTAGDIETILEHDGQGPSIVIVPSRDGTGTNAILRRPPDLFPSHFGPDSLAKHLAEAAAAKAACSMIELHRIALDIDDPSDVSELIRRGQGASVYELLAAMGVPERLSLK